MGQYHIPVNLSKKEFINPHRLGDGLKLWEQGASQGGTLCALHALLAVSNGRGGGDYIDGHQDFIGRWGGDRIAIIGDYAEANDLDATDYAESIYTSTSYASYPDDYSAEDVEKLERSSGTGWVDISDLARAFLSEQWRLEFGNDGWVSRTALPGSPFADEPPAMKPDFIIGLGPE
jgi:hypothetical protein